MMQALYSVALLVVGKLSLLENGICVPFGEIKRTSTSLPFLFVTPSKYIFHDSTSIPMMSSSGKSHWISSVSSGEQWAR